MAYMVYILVECDDTGKPAMMRRSDGGIYLFREGILAGQIARAFRRGGRKVGVVSFDLQTETPNLI